MVKVDQCTARDHGVNSIEANLFCREDGCRVAVCVHCFLSNHRNHCIVGIDEERQRLMTEMGQVIETRSSELKKKKMALWGRKDTITCQNRQCVDSLKKSKEDIIKMISDQFDEAIDAVNRDVGEFDQHFGPIDHQLTLMAKIKTGIKDSLSLQELKFRENLINKGNSKSVSDKSDGQPWYASVHYFNPDDLEDQAENLCELIRTKKRRMQVNYPMQEVQPPGSAVKVAGTGRWSTPGRVTNLKRQLLAQQGHLETATVTEPPLKKPSLRNQPAATGVALKITEELPLRAEQQKIYPIGTISLGSGSKVTASGLLSEASAILGSAASKKKKKKKSRAPFRVANPETTEDERMNLRVTVPVAPQRAAKVPQFKFTVRTTIHTPFCEIHYMLPPGDNTVLVATSAVEERRRSRMCKLNLDSGEVVSTVALKVFYGMALFRYGGMPLIALSDQNGCKIRWLDSITLNQINHTSLSPDWPSCICAAQPECLLYVDESEQPLQVKFINYGGYEPSATEGICSQKNRIRDMCYVQRDSGRMVVLTHGVTHRGLTEELEGVAGDEIGVEPGRSKAGAAITGYDFLTGAKLWRVQGKLVGMEREIRVESLTTDCRGHIYACDTNNSTVHMFSYEGKYVGAVLKSGDQGMGEPKLIRWCKNSAALLVAHKKPGDMFKVSKCQLVKFNIKPSL